MGGGDNTSTFLGYLHRLCLDFDLDFLSSGHVGGIGDILPCNQVIDR
ncbi:MAG TPA: hypothetical protein VE544_06510 [Nitrososphaeraceae archaeon]|nr:hypothetical protein [Nitrososphaeraceae archaeon]